jgi:hypothetical protein
MPKKLLTLLLGTVLFSGKLFAQTGDIKVTLVDEKTAETLPFAGVVVLQKTAQVGSGTTDIDGNVVMKLLPPGSYNVKATLLGYQPAQVNNVQVNEGKTTYLTLKLSSTVVQGKEVVITDYKVPLIDPGTKVQKTVTREAYQAMAAKNPTNVVAQAAGVFQKDDNGSINVRGGRSDVDRDGNSTGESSTKTFIDGVRVVGGSGVPQQAIEQISIITGGVPAEFGDATSGVVNITTRGPGPTYFGGVEAISSEPFDKFGYNFLGYSLGGPIVKEKGNADRPGRTLLGFMLGGEFSTEKDNNPSAIGTWKVKDDVLRNLEKNPLRPNPVGGTLRNAEFVGKSDLEPIAARQNVRANIIRLNGKIDFKPTEQLLLTLGGSLDYNRRHDFVREYALFNPSNNPEKIDKTYRVYGRLTQRFGNQSSTKDEKSASTVKNAYLTLQGSYTWVNNLSQDDSHKNRLFDYGYLGKYDIYKAPVYAFGLDTSTGFAGYRLVAFADTMVKFTPDTLTNPSGAAYTSQYYQFYQNRRPDGLYDNLFNIQFGGGLLNGDRPINIYNLWYNTGRQYNGYTITDNRQLRFTGQISADVKNHNIQVGFEYEQRNEASMSINPIGLWTLARQLANVHISQLDYGNPQPVYVDGSYQGIINYDRKSDDSLYTGFAKNFREKFGIDKKTWVNVDAVNKNDMDLSMFSMDNLLNQGNPLVSTYYGFDPITMKRNRKKVELDDFFKKSDDGTYKRSIDAFRPIYMAGYIQDKFDFKDIKFNVGLRVDRFDANQKVLKDPYVLYETYKLSEVSTIAGKAVTHPDNLEKSGQEYVVYVNDFKNPQRIVGYRSLSDNRWYDTQGNEVTDPSKIANAAGGKIQPYLVDPTVGITKPNFDSKKSFTDYKPQINFMPRLAFSFPISDVANFFAHYDILTQRPPARLRLDPTDYYFIEAQQGPILNNPNLKPERTIDYEVGFTQILGEVETANSSISISGFYREMKDMIQLVRLNQAYPVTYLSYGNIDFGTVKGLSVSYDLRRTNNVALNVNYTLQFADGTGSASTEAFNLLQSGQPNLRTTNPLDFDQRHQLVANVDYRFGTGADYNGPTWFGTQFLALTGANLTMRYGSGIPFSRNRFVLREGDISGGGSNGLDGSINGSRMPANIRFDLRVERSVKLKFGSKDSDKRKSATLNIYLQVLNLLNTRNVVEVYKYSGNADDDGYLTALRSQAEIRSQISEQSYRDLYSIKVNNPANYSLPRRTRLGVTLDF